jgi:hypothetical protein
MRVVAAPESHPTASMAPVRRRPVPPVRRGVPAHGAAPPSARDIYAGRGDVVGFAQRRRKLMPLTKKLELTHPELKVQGGDKNVIIIDIDELGTSGTTQTGAGGAAASASVGMLFFLSGLTLLAFFGTYSSLSALKGSTKELAVLGENRRKLLKKWGRAVATHGAAAGPWPSQDTLARMLRENKHLRSRAHVSRTFMGGFGGLGATLVGCSILANEQMLGALAGGLAAAASPLMFAATPVTTVFGAGLAGWEAYRFVRSVQVQRKVSTGLAATPVGTERLARRLLKKRLRALRFVTTLKGSAYLSLAVGVPMAVFGGPYGLPVLLYGAAGMVASGIVEGVMTGYQPQLSFADRLALRDRYDITNSIAQTHAQLALLRAQRREKKLLYPHGYDGMLPVKYLVRGVAAARRGLTGAAKAYPPSCVTVRRVVQGFADIAIEGAQNDVRASRLRRATFLQGMGWATHSAAYGLWMNKLDRDHAAAKAALAMARHERRALDGELHDHGAFEAACFSLMRFFVREGMLRSFGAELLKHKELRQSFAAHGIVTRDHDDWHFDANKLVLYFTRTDPVHAAGMLAHVFDVAEKVLLMVERRHALWRERDLLDVLAEDLTTPV